jgi:hypothetical protein
MKFELILFGVTAFLIYNTYHDGKYTKYLKLKEKYVKMAMYGFGALTIYIFLKKQPNRGKSLLMHANNFIKYMPIDRDTSDIITPILDFTSDRTELFETRDHASHQQQHTPQMNRMLHSGKGQNMKRSVSETKKKYVASRQMWKCGHCNQQLDHTFEVDHIKDLQYGGDNSVDNLVALCRNCHGKKTHSFI